MASANKQQKRATRAKAKAKQNRTQRAAAPGLLTGKLIENAP